MTSSSVIPFPNAARHPAPVQDATGEARAYHLGLLSEAGLAAREALADIYRATRTHYRGKALGEADSTLSGETLGSLASATIRMIDLRGSRNSDLELRRALTRWLDDNGGKDG
ncbi:hypothetical protein MRS76_03195 [Rhizobiaceae bacterium n13]|uniref:Uncharacterized protein n=1 Tax=Ferirhizobium litorale TaxID=2927786 RepID=A0AAE3TZK9_9HYPH|nr:hypothetical protein [Fererhizobium litorale]MDI7860951.1 hypothetical protein [Fererhizobium litorale]MDI7921099.1 hypothetical protein [Fererhizobium litorale]